VNPGNGIEGDFSGVADLGVESRDEPSKDDVTLVDFTFKVDGLEEPRLMLSCAGDSKCTRLSPSLRRRLTGRSGKSRDCTRFRARTFCRSGGDGERHRRGMVCTEVVEVDGLSGKFAERNFSASAL